MPRSTTLEHVPDERAINSLQIICTSTPKCEFHFSICLYLNRQGPQMTHSGNSSWPHGILRNESFHVPENQVQWEALQLIIQFPPRRDRILWSETAGVTEYESPTFYPKPGGTFKVSDIASLIHNKDLENELAWEDKCNCWYWV